MLNVEGRQAMSDEDFEEMEVVDSEAEVSDSGEDEEDDILGGDDGDD